MRRAHWLKSSLTVPLALVAMLAFGVAAAESLSDFQIAKKAMDDEKGCESIPYYSLRSNCITQQALVHPWCDGERGPVSCEKGVTAALNTKITQLSKPRDALKRELDGLKRDLSSASASEKSALQRRVDQKQRELDTAEEEVEKKERELTAHRASVDAAIKAINTCLDARHAVMNVFGAAKDKVSGERDPEIMPIARELKDGYEASKRGHEIAITGKENALNTCLAEAR